MPRLLSFFLISSLILLSSCRVSKDGLNDELPEAFDFINQNTSLADVLARAKLENKLVFVDFYATWCRPCQLMDEEVFTDKKLAEYFNANFINYKVDGEKGSGYQLATFFEVRAYPTLLFLDSNGKVINKKEGLAFYRELKSLARKSIKESEKK